MDKFPDEILVKIVEYLFKPQYMYISDLLVIYGHQFKDVSSLIQTSKGYYTLFRNIVGVKRYKKIRKSYKIKSPRRRLKLLLF